MPWEHSGDYSSNVIEVDWDITDTLNEGVYKLFIIASDISKNITELPEINIEVIYDDVSPITSINIGSPNYSIDDVLYITTFKGTGAKPQQIRTPLITLDALNNTDLKDFIVRINTDRGKDNMIPTDRLSDYLKLIQIQEESEEQPETTTDEETVTDTQVPGATPTIEVPTTESQILDFDMKMLDDAVKNMSFSKYNYLRKIVDLPPIPDDVTFEKYKQSLEDAYYGRETDEELLKEQNKIIPVLKEQMKKY